LLSRFARDQGYELEREETPTDSKKKNNQGFFFYFFFVRRLASP